MQDAWIPCRLYIKTQGQKPRAAYIILHDAAGMLEPRASVALLIRHPDGVIFQVPGRVARRRGAGAVEIYIPLDAALSLAAHIGARVEGNTAVYGYAAQVKEVRPPAV
jgi:hypothetical protein